MEVYFFFLFKSLNYSEMCQDSWGYSKRENLVQMRLVVRVAETSRVNMVSRPSEFWILMVQVGCVLLLHLWLTVCPFFFGNKLVAGISVSGEESHSELCPESQGGSCDQNIHQPPAIHCSKVEHSEQIGLGLGHVLYPKKYGWEECRLRLPGFRVRNLGSG